MGWMKKVRDSIQEQKTLEERFFAVVVMVGLAIVTVSMIVTFMEEISSIANIGTMSGGVMLLIVIYLAYVRKKIIAARVILCYAFNLVVIPIAFFSCGGIDSGMPLYMLAGIFTFVPVLKGKHRIIGLVISFVVDVICVITSYYMTPGVAGSETKMPNILAQLSVEARFIDMICSIVLIGLYVIITTTLIMDAYQKERARREALLEKLDDLSKRDELTGLFNRRELFHFLENLQLSENVYYLCMIDVDHFKRVNDTYGHVFGDLVLRKLAEILKKEIRSGEGELAARYGGEEFLIVLKADGREQALERLGLIKKRFVETKWEEDESFHVSFSGGMVRCAEHKTYAEAISQADKLLYKAKENGRNRLEA